MPDDSTAMDHVRHLAGSIGPRGTGTAGERAAAEHARRHLTDLGLDVHVEPFAAPASGWRGFAIAAATALAATAAFVFGGRLGAALGGAVLIVATVLVFLEMYFRPNPLRALVPRCESRNVWARLRPAEAPAARVVLVAHLDTHRTPWAFRSPARLTLFRVTTAVGIVSFVLGAALFVAGALVDLGAWRWTAAPLAPVYALVLALTWPTDRTPYTAGANDNASGVGVVLSLATRLANAPLARTEVSVVLSGAEESAPAVRRRSWPSIAASSPTPASSRSTTSAAAGPDRASPPSRAWCGPCVPMGACSPMPAAWRRSAPTSARTSVPTPPCTPTPRASWPPGCARCRSWD